MTRTKKESSCRVHGVHGVIMAVKKAAELITILDGMSRAVFMASYKLTTSFYEPA